MSTFFADNETVFSVTYFKFDRSNKIQPLLKVKNFMLCNETLLWRTTRKVLRSVDGNSDKCARAFCRLGRKLLGTHKVDISKFGNLA